MMPKKIFFKARAKKAPGANQAGVALLISLAVVALLVAVTVELHRNISASVFSTAATRDRRQADWAAQSGIMIAKALLVEDKKKTKFDSMQEDWANDHKISELLYDFSFGDASVSIKISDCMGQIQINALVKPPFGQHFKPAQNELWDKFLRPIVTQHEDLDINATTDIINSIKDWLDSQDDNAITGLNGAESGYYQDQDPPYVARNGHITTVDELLLVKGVTDELFFGKNGIAGIMPYITTFGADLSGKKQVDYPGKVNIGTASLPVLQALLPTENEDLAGSIIEYREQRDDLTYVNGLSSDKWYQNAPGCSELTISTEISTNISDYFEIKATASVNDVKKIITAVVHRQKAANSSEYECRIISWDSL